MSDSERLTVPPDGRPDEMQPPWRRDFPIDTPQAAYVSRRDFTRFMVLVSLSFTTGQFWILLQNWLRQARPPLTAQPLARVDELAVGESRLVYYPTEKDPVILVRMDETNFVAYNQLCTHLLCPVVPAPEEGILHCPCHDGEFDLATGRPIAGPPVRPLTLINLEIRDGVIYATGVEERTA